MQKAIRRLCGRRVKLTTLLHLVPRLRMRGAIPLLPLYAFMSWTRITLLLPSSMNKNVAATRPDIGPVFNLTNLLTDSVGRFGWLEWGSPQYDYVPTCRGQHRPKIPTCLTTPQARSGTLSWCELQAYVNMYRPVRLTAGGHFSSSQTVYKRGNELQML
jgi:hypothetical protein